MYNMKKSIALMLFAILALSNYSFAQRVENSPNIYHLFDIDSLRGFDEEAARRSAISEQFLGAEFKVRMYQLKRRYINDKFNLWPKESDDSFRHANKVKSNVVPGCVNEDFEASTAGIITVTNQIAGWTVTRGVHTQVPNANSCNLLACCPSAPVESELISAPNGYIDNTIGNCYPIFSVFGSTPGNANGPVANPQITGGMFGDNFIRINSSNNDFSVEKLSKTFSVTANNAIFQFAFISVMNAGHGCCDAGAFQIGLPGIACPSFSASALSAQCVNTTQVIEFLGAQTCQTVTVNNANVIFNKWKISSMDLTQYIGQSITIEIVASDCTGGGHYGYVYFDAQCGPMTITGNGNVYPAGTNSVVVPTCGASGATMCATAGLGPYSWAGPNVPIGYTIPSYTNQCYTSSLSATYTLYMNPPGSCAPIQRVINTTITPAPQINASVLQATCGQTLASITATPGGSAIVPASLAWSGSPLSLNQNTTVAVYVIPPGPAPAIVTITIKDPLGCKVSTTVSVSPAPPNPTFNIINTSGTYSITCYNPSLNLGISTNYNYNNNQLNYFWASNSSTFVTASVTVNQAGTYTVIGSDPVTLCAAIRTVAIGVNTTVPLGSLSPTLQNITCGSPTTAIITAVANTPSINITHFFSSPIGGTYSITNSSTGYVPGIPGTYTYVLQDNVTGCTSIKQFSITSASNFPTFSLTSAPLNFTLGCSTKSVTTLQITGPQTNPPGFPTSYTVLGPSSPSVLPLVGNLSNAPNYSVIVPGTWTVVCRDNSNSCDTRIPVSVLSNTLGPKLDTVYADRTILTCSSPSVDLVAFSSNTNAQYDWKLPSNTSIQNDSLSVFSLTNTPTATLVANYTLVVTDANSLCKTTTVVPIAQNLFPPKAKITAGVPELSCKTPTVLLTNSSSHGLPSTAPFTPGVPVSVLWKGPSPSLDETFTSTYLGRVPGTYSMTARDSNNGCETTTIVVIVDNFDYPIITSAPEATLDCGSTATTQVRVTGNFTVSSWTNPPTAQTTPHPDKLNLIIDTPGDYRITVTNTNSGCFNSTLVEAVTGSLTPDFESDKISGFAPLTVNFTNKSKTATSTSSITSIWNYGNGTTATYTNAATAQPFALYDQPGSYTVTMYAKRGTCLEKKQLVINVEIPSSMIVPNVFTPNGDKINDLFFLQRADNLSKISCVIIDRWGHKVYELETEKGQIEWDGKNQLGKDAPEGVYFYTIKATGKDDQKYDLKGTVNLFR